MKKIFWDSNLFIYLFEQSKQKDLVEGIFSYHLKNDYQIITSSLTVLEVLQKPYKSSSDSLLQTYQRFFNSIEIYSFTREMAEKAASFSFKIKSQDSAQLASAVMLKADVFLTNDFKLCELRDFIDSLEILSLKEFFDWSDS